MDMEDSPVGGDWAKDIKSDAGLNDLQKMKDEEMSKAERPDGPPDGFQLVLPFLDLSSRSNVARLNKSLNEAVKDPLVWMDPMLDWRVGNSLTNETLLELVERADGHLRSLFLMNASKITDEALSRIFELNPRLERISVPGCTEVNADNLVSLVEGHSLKARAKGLPGIRQVRLFKVGREVNNITPQHLLRLGSVLGVSRLPRDEAWSSRRYYGNRGGYIYGYSEAKDKRPVDVELCPDCRTVGLVFDCPNFKDTDSRDPSSSEYEEWVYSLPDYDCNHYVSCRACTHCIPRCQECGICLRPDPDEFDVLQSLPNKSVCGDLLCSSCWLVLPKCIRCERLVCSLHEEGCFPRGREELCIECYDEVHGGGRLFYGPIEGPYSYDEEDLET